MGFLHRWRQNAGHRVAEGTARIVARCRGWRHAGLHLGYTGVVENWFSGFYNEDGDE
ncbi:protein of unknown function [Acidithiobacillus ferrivorans]|uniref:Transposase n=1 Tax=Acidithiobacillus ferrivorans TaxID=160808 RepID=A0ABY1MUC8_9PROT|nr:hypothetical protein [Acidithiobacillus sp. MC6.1]SMH67411.1 protein of unknown function [Acidithiobacillus ferrivorans]